MNQFSFNGQTRLRPYLLGCLSFLIMMPIAQAKLSAAQKAHAIFQATGIQSGLAVHLAPKDEQLTMALTHKQQMVVHALALDAQSLGKVRDGLLKTGFYGLASAEIPHSWTQLPYAPQSVNLVYTSQLSKILNKGASIKQLWETVVPYGSMMLQSEPKQLTRKQLDRQLSLANLNAEVSGAEASGFTILAKKGAEPGTDHWTHWKYSPEGNAMSKDTKVKPPTHLKWISGDESIPRIGPGTKPGWRFWKGNAVYHWDDGPGYQDVNQLIMRDAYNGTLKWKKDDVTSNNDWMPMIYINDKIYFWAKSITRGEKIRKDKEIVAFNEQGEEALHWNIPDNLTPDIMDLNYNKNANIFNFTQMMILKGKLIVTYGNHIIAFNPEKSNEIIWSKSLPKHKWAVGAVASEDENKLFFIVSDLRKNFPMGARWIGSYGHDDIRALSLDDGELVWKMNRWGQGVTDSLYGTGQLVYNDGILYSFIGLGGSLSADQTFYKFVSGGKFTKETPYTAMYGAIDTKSGSPLWIRNWGAEIPYWHGENKEGPKNTRPGSNNALFWNNKFIEYRNGAFTDYEPRTGSWRRVARDTKVIGERLGIKPGEYNSSGNNRCARATATPNYLLGGYVMWYDKDYNYDFKPVRRSGCASQVYPANGMTYYSPSGCGCYIMVNSPNAGKGPGSHKRAGKGNGGRGFVALGNSGSVKVVKSDYRLDTPAPIKASGESQVYPNNSPGTSIRILRKSAYTQMGPILSDWPENIQVKGNRSKGVLAKRTGWDRYQKDEYTFQSLGSALQVEISNSGKVIDRVVMGGRLALAPVKKGDMVYLGSKDGYVYAYNLKNKKLQWRFLAAPSDYRILVASQLESHWPISHLQVEEDGQLHVMAGRHYDMGGIFTYRLDLISGKVYHREILKGNNWSAFEGQHAQFSYDETETKPFVVTNARTLAQKGSSYSVDGKQLIKDSGKKISLQNSMK